MTPISTPSSTDNIPLMLVLNDGYPLSRTFYEHIKRHVESRLCAVSSDTIFSLKQICCPKFWDGLSDGERRTAGICVANMAAKNELPLIQVLHKHEYPKKYRRT
jgi:hypothetical protein